MTMYTDLLRTVVDNWADDLTGDALIDHTVARRAEMLRAHANVHQRQDEASYEALAAEVAYDRALLKLCEGHDIDAHPEGFSRPGEERLRLERQLANAGVNLKVPACPRHAP
jgi:hypothetical protein